MVNSTFFFLKPKNTTKFIKSNLFYELNLNKFNVVTIYLNKKVYTVSQLKKINSFHYKKEVAVMYQFLLTTLKPSIRLK